MVIKKILTYLEINAKLDKKRYFSYVDKKNVPEKMWKYLKRSTLLKIMMGRKLINKTKRNHF